jgi:hypoxanthine-DNA glycosylase
MVRSAQGFPPVIDGTVETLILGSFPGVASLGKQQYYGHPQNQFWRLVGAVIGEPLPEMDYAARLRTLLAHRIGLWDVLGSCSRKGSLDANIRNPRPNDLVRVTGVAPNLRRIFFNGKTAGRFEWQFAGCGYEIAMLPSSSPAYTLSFEEKLEQWRQIGAPPKPAQRGNARRRSTVSASVRPVPQPAGPKC